MKLVSFRTKDECGFGAVMGDRIVRLDRAHPECADLAAFIGGANSATSARSERGDDIAISAIRLLPPILNPGKIFCVATNFHEPSREGKPDPDYPLVFTRFADTFVGHDQPLSKPVFSDRYDFEGELAVIIGRHGYRIARERALEHVAGYTCLNDGSVRDWQKHSPQFTLGKNFSRSGSIGPWIITPEEIADVGALTLVTRVNGVEKQRISLGQMIFDVPWLISYLSTIGPLAPGDIIATGTPSGFGSSRTPPEFLSVGDIIEVEITNIGTLRNVVAESEAT